MIKKVDNQKETGEPMIEIHRNGMIFKLSEKEIVNAFNYHQHQIDVDDTVTALLQKESDKFNDSEYVNCVAYTARDLISNKGYDKDDAIEEAFKMVEEEKKVMMKETEETLPFDVKKRVHRR